MYLYTRESGMESVGEEREQNPDQSKQEMTHNVRNEDDRRDNIRVDIGSVEWGATAW